MGLVHAVGLRDNTLAQKTKSASLEDGLAGRVPLQVVNAAEPRVPVAAAHWAQRAGDHKPSSTPTLVRLGLMSQELQP